MAVKLVKDRIKIIIIILHMRTHVSEHLCPNETNIKSEIPHSLRNICINFRRVYKQNIQKKNP